MRLKLISLLHDLGEQSHGLKNGLSVLTVAVATLMTLHFSVISEKAAFLIFFFAVVHTSFWLGLHQGILTIIISLATVNILILKDVWYSDYGDAIILNLFFCLATTSIAVTTSYHKNLTAKLQESRQGYSALVEAAVDAIVSIDAEQHIRLFNPAAEKMFGCTAQEALGISITHFIPYFSEHIQAFGLTDDTKAKQTTTKGRRANGEEFSIEASIFQYKLAGITSFNAILRDVTERQNTEHALQERLMLQDQLSKVAASTPGLICSFRLRPDGTASMPYASPLFASIYGLDYYEIKDDFSPVFANFHPDDISHIHASIAESADSMEPWRASFRYNHPIKGEVWLEGHSLPLIEDDGSILWHGYIKDITEIKHSEQKLQESRKENEFLASLVRLSSQPIGVGYADGGVGLVNNAFGELTGYSIEELLNINWATVLTPPEWHEVERNILAELNCTGSPVRYEKEYIKKNGARVPVELLVHLMTDDKGKPQFYYAFINDITERKRAAESMRASEAFVRDVLNSLPVQVVVLDDDGLVSTVNELWERFAMENGGSPEEVSVGANYLEVCRRSSTAGDPHAAKALEGLQALYAGQSREFVMEYSCPTSNRTLWFLMHARRVVDGFQGVILTHTDITELKSAESALSETEVRLALVVTAAIAHELNQPLTAISSYADVAQKLLKSGNPNPQKLAHVLESCVEQAQRAGQVIQHLLRQLQNSRFISESLDINSMVHETVDMIGKDQEFGAIKLELALDSGLPPVLANALQIQKVLTNLICNSLESMQERGNDAKTMVITTRRSDSDADMMQLTVCDSGTGVINKAMLREIFKPFYSTKPNGLGMGLSISRALIHAHSGRMWAEANAINGLSVHFTLPFQQ